METTQHNEERLVEREIEGEIATITLNLSLIHI